ncbi:MULTISPECIES: MFS transporter [unclassified Amycolatopsis]|uniref:MFS transporter n=1 Tax=unclassified Amycolatopsis TaxID=2618356 RepID=UPI001C6A2F6C|nr:MFS transporter [Amycolatopsis sp. DSM 110486]QYN22701.1 MFS transporter [Amycolatopsis sp. DSM 110486]
MIGYSLAVSLLEPLRGRSFRALATGRTLATFANAVAPVALAFAVLDLTGSAVDLGLVVGVRSVANVALVLFGGVLADRLPRSVIMQGTEAAAAITQGALAVSVLCGFASIPFLVGLSAVNGAVAAISLPAAAAITPQTVSRGRLSQANALLRLLTNTGRVAGAGVAGIVVAVAGSGWAVAVNALLFLAAAVAYRGIRLPRGARVEASHPIADLIAGWHEFRSRAWVWIVVVQFAFVNAAGLGTLVVIGPVVADETFGRTGWGLALAIETVGSIFGGLIAARWQPRRAMFVGVLLVMTEALPMFSLGLWPALVPLLLTMALAGLTMEQFSVIWDVSLQENIPEDRLARVYSYDVLGSLAAMPIGQIAAGPLVEHLGREPVLLGCGVLIVMATLLALSSRQVRGLVRRRPVAADTAPAT